MIKDKEKLDVIFLDFDGVINIKADDFSGTFQNPDAIHYLNELCLETGFKIVVCSSWRDHMDYEKFLKNSGLDERIEVLGKTEVCNKGRQFEIKKYVEDHNVGRYIIIDDAYLGEELTPHHVQTAPRLGFNQNKYEEAIIKISKMNY